MTDEEKCYQNISLARAFIKQKAVYVLKTLYGFIPHLVPGLGTLGVSEKMVLLIDPVWFNALPLEQHGGVLMHEISHVARGLPRLRALPNRELANIAFDIPINFDLRNADWKLPSWVVYPETYGLPIGLTGEEYYELLDKQLRAGNEKLLGALGGGQVGSGKCGGCAGNPTMPSIEEAVNKEIGRPTASVEHIRRATAKDIQEAVKRGRGDIPKTLQEWLPDEGERVVRISWQSRLSYILRRVVGQIMSGRSDYSYRRPSRRSFMYGRIVPGMISRKPVVGFVEDSSGSMGTSQLLECRHQAVDVMSQLGIERAWWISADATVTAPPRIVSMRQIKELPVIGRGGTDFRPAIEQALTLRPKPDLLMYLTDGDGTAPEFPPPGMQVVFCIVPSYYNKAPADWGYTIILQDEIAA